MTPPPHVEVMLDGDQTARLIYLGLILASLGGWVMVEYRKRMGVALRSALAWGMIVVGLMAGYGLWGDIRQDIMPVQAISGQQVTIPRAADGHYYPSISVGGHEISFMADTGASSIVLSPADARKLGIDPAGLTFFGQAMTANGVVRTATVTLQDVSFGPFHDDSVTAQVNEAEMENSLLGMDYLGRFSVTMAGDEMVLSR